MTDPRYARLERIFTKACSLGGPERTAFLDEAYRDEPELREEVEALLAADAEAQDTDPGSDGAFDAGAGAHVLAHELARQGKLGREPGATAPGVPETIGPYRILSVLGRGGMGLVYRAEQHKPRRTVALKVLQPGFVRKDMLERFEQEAQLLGLLQHPVIASIYDAGTFGGDDGDGEMPYFAMELVEGERLTAFAEQHGLDARARIGLVARICSAVQHAHERGVIHRDLKPANILVVPEDTGSGGPQPKILDFGIARTTDDAQFSVMQTRTGLMLGTLAYMSPEQVSGQGGVDARSDVYSLGVILYELLTGRLPLDFEGRSLTEVGRIAHDQDPVRLGRIRREYRGDLETICDKALAKEKELRYATAADLGEDLLHYLRNEPITARPQTTLYQLRKFARRHKALVGGVLTTLFVAIAGAVVATLFALDAERRSAELERVAAFYSGQWRQIDTGLMGSHLREDVLRAAQASLAGEPETPVAQVEAVLARMDFPDVALSLLEDKVFATALTTLDRDFADLPLVQARLMQTLSETMARLGMLDAALEPQQRALELRREWLGEEHPDTLRSLANLGRLLLDLGQTDPERFGEAEAMLRKSLAAQRRALPRDHADIENTLTWLGQTLARTGGGAEAAEVQREITAISTQRHGAANPSTLLALAGQLLNEGELEDAVATSREALAGFRRDFGDDHVATLIVIGNLASLLHSTGELDDAEALLREMVAGTRERLGEAQVHTMNAMFMLGSVLRDQAELGEAEPLLRRALALMQEHLGEEHPKTLEARHALDLLLEAKAR